jgi:4'-phosphopantetheinyl transferase
VNALHGWRPAPAFPQLAAGDAHVWRIPIGPELPVSQCWTLLSADEQAHASKLRHDADRNAYVLAHGAMRMILASYARSAPRDLRFHHGQFGKPALAPSGSSLPLDFSLAHSGELALLAVARDRAVGIDVSGVDPAADIAGVAERFFSPVERQTLRSLRGSPERTVDAFYAAWTRKEAYVKATGHGLARGLDHFDVSFAPGEAPRLLADRLDADAPSRWTIFAVDAGAGYSAALVVAKPVAEVVLFDAPAFAAGDPDVNR